MDDYGSMGGGGGIAPAIGVLAVTVIGVVAIIVMGIAKALEEVYEAKADAAWAKAMEMAARADLVDARTAQISSILGLVAPLLIAALIIAAAFGVVLLVYGTRTMKSVPLPGVPFAIQSGHSSALPEPLLYVPPPEPQAYGGWDTCVEQIDKNNKVVVYYSPDGQRWPPLSRE